MSTTVHLCVDRQGLIRNLRNGTWKASDVTKGYTKAQLIAKLESMTDRVLPMGEPCDRFDPEKGCLGHREETVGELGVEG